MLRMMHEVDFLGKYMPEFGLLTCLVQHEYFHRYTADEHTIVCIEKLDSLIDTEDPKLAPYKSLFLKLEDPYVLYLALLLHDTGKASGARHHAEASALNAQKVAARLQLSPERRRKLILLVDHHMTLSEIAQRRNLEDSATIADFAEIVRSHENLDALMLLTLADGQGTGGQNWSDWKETLVWHLYHATSSYFHDERNFSQSGESSGKTCSRLSRREWRRTLGRRSKSIFVRCPIDISRVTTSMRSSGISGYSFIRGNAGPEPEDGAWAAVKWHTKPDQGHSEFWICTWDRTALMAKIAGSFATASINILSADAYTRADNLMLGIFRVCDTSFRPVSPTSGTWNKLSQSSRHHWKKLISTSPRFLKRRENARLFICRSDWIYRRSWSSRTRFIQTTPLSIFKRRIGSGCCMTC